MRTETRFFASFFIFFLAAGLAAPLSMAHSEANSANLKSRVQEACLASFETSWSSWQRLKTGNSMSKEQFFANFTYVADGCRNNAQAIANVESMREQEKKKLTHWTAREHASVANNIHSSLDGMEARLCVLRWLASPQCAAGGSTTAARPSSSGSAGTASPSAAPPAAPNRAQAQQRQAALDEQRRGRPKRHYSDREAHQCLRLVKENTNYGGFTNTCSFPVRFSYCAYKPKKGAWTESFNCETGSFGGHALIKAGDRSSHHTRGAEKIYWFACRADSPSNEIYEVGDAEFDASVPTIRARCVKWGDRS